MGAQNQPFLAANQWQAQIAYQYGYAYQFYQGDQRNDAGARFGQPPTRKVNIFDVDLAYGLSNRVSLQMTLPFLSGSGSAPSQSPAGTVESHNTYYFQAGGLGDISLESEVWLSDPTKPSRITGSVGLGFRAPTGPDTVKGTFYDPKAGGEVQAPIDEAYQLGSGGWAALFFAQGSAQITGALFGYGSGYYGMSLKEHTEVINAGALRGVPDTYSGRLGLAYLLPVFQGFVVSFGGRINGVTVKDIVGGGDLYWRRPGYEVFVEPGITWTVGPNSASISVPLRVYQNKLDSLLDVSLNRHVGADFVPYLFLASFARRF